jgi:hypothetical protein
LLRDLGYQRRLRRLICLGACTLLPLLFHLVDPMNKAGRVLDALNMAIVALQPCGHYSAGAYDYRTLVILGCHLRPLVFRSYRKPTTYPHESMRLLKYQDDGCITIASFDDNAIPLMR